MVKFIVCVTFISLFSFISNSNVNSVPCKTYCLTINSSYAGSFTGAFSSSGQRLCTCVWEFFLGCDSACCSHVNTGMYCDNVTLGADCLVTEVSDSWGYPQNCYGSCHGGVICGGYWALSGAIPCNFDGQQGLVTPHVCN